MGGWQEGMLSCCGSALLSPCPEYDPGALLAQSRIKKLPLGKGSWLVSPSSIPPSLGHGAGDIDCLHVGSYAEISGLLANGLPAG